MKVSCPACDSKYTIADEKVAGRKVKVRCKSCGGQILINGTIPPPAPDPSAPADDDATRVFTGTERKAFDATHAADTAGAATQTAKVPSEASSKEAAKSAPTQSEPEQSMPLQDDGIIWSVNVSDDDERSLKTHEVVAGYLSGEFAGEVYVWHDGMGDWAAIPDVPTLASAIEAAKTQASKAPPQAKQKALPGLAKGGKTSDVSAAPMQEATAKKTAARVVGAKRPQSAHDLFAAASAAGSELDVPVSEEDDAQKRTGARNENSVLFSLDALKAGITAAPAQQQSKPTAGKKAPTTPRKKLEDLMGDMGSPLATGPAASPLLLAANQSLLTAPAPPPPKPKPEPVEAPDPAVSAAAINYAREKEKTKRMLIGVIAAIVGLGAIAGIAIGMTKNKPESASVPSARTVVSAPVAVAVPEPVKTPEPAAASPAESAAASAATPTQKLAAAAQAGTKTSAVTAAVKPTETKKEPKKEEPPSGPVSSGVGSFNKDAASQALSVAASQTSICKKPDGPTGQGKVQVTFAPSGRATTANIVSGPFGGTAVGGCVSGVFKRARVPPFSGDPVTVSKSFSIIP
jgi:predicted Zn finger-like uncharacterized protein